MYPVTVDNKVNRDLLDQIDKEIIREEKKIRFEFDDPPKLNRSAVTERLWKLYIEKGESLFNKQN